MADVVHVHIGAPKTGTTYLQDRLYLNRSVLEGHGVTYPVGLHRDHFGAAIDLTERPWGDIGENMEGRWDSLAAKVRRVSGHVVISHELFAAATLDQVKRAMRGLGDAEIHVVYSQRDLARQIPSEFQESAKHRRAKSFASYLMRVQTEPRRNPDWWFWRSHSLPDVLNRWTQGLPPEQVHLVTVPQSRGEGESLWERYCRALAVDPAWLPEDSRRTNPSLGIDETVLLRRLNRRLRKAGLEQESYDAIVRGLLIQGQLAKKGDVRRITVPPSSYDWIDEVTDEWVEWVRASGIDVVGDLEDLRSVRPAPDATWANPDRPRPKLVNKAAMKALETLVLELAERPDPSQSATARIGRLAKHLRGQ
jgi:hypothetical protein